MSTHRTPLPAFTPEVGEVVRDAKHDAVGVYAGRLGPWAYLRPRGGGIEWETKLDRLERLTGELELVSRLRASPRWAHEDEGAA